MENEPLFKPDFSKLRFIIKIEVYENGQFFSLERPTGSEYKASYQEVIGAIEIQRISMINNQSDFNKKAYTKHKKKQNGK